MEQSVGVTSGPWDSDLTNHLDSDSDSTLCMFKPSGVQYYATTIVLL